ncbi:rho GTPase-activating protein 24 isoform X1 [Onychostoma macrolepis]|uniref:rho GTPase-activating protein 24 isoform X1 n=1 Tax=Onychostoma macrolepis TaxID=369639 RepID=UPI00272D73CE|nr:rho GTPase-activating protein 24 isoform X1 [Onychostoma macrolepis]XP_058613682.1 rho GTPase-activating protein 24 isoform X1 [Onychostoma macrolepis]XP_058613683.1 rho GTPase-activating protein 24 isoform X1 [Onychostoma macrolepis]XP_058613684.1 rho GTPase-activating protein 24 isoform X1 [Onychostoma macrolepis]
MPENKQTIQRTGSYLSHSAYRKIKRVLSFRRRVFGQRLEETVLYERRYGDHMAPLVVEQCVDFIREHGLTEVGLFRQPGQATLVKELQEAFDAGEKPSFDSSTDVHTVASLLKLYLRELPEPLVPFSRYEEFLVCGKRIPSDREKGLQDLRSLLYELPVANFNLLKYICQFLNDVQSYSNVNKMSIQNLATVFGPNILRPKAEDPESIIGGAAVVQHLMSELIREHSLLFSRENCNPPETSLQAAFPIQRHSNLVEWVHEPPAHLREPLLSKDHMVLPDQTVAGPHKHSLPLNTEKRESFQSPCDKIITHLSETEQQLQENSSPTSSALIYDNYNQSSPAQESLHTRHIPTPSTPLPACSSLSKELEAGVQICMQSRSWPDMEEPSWGPEKALGESGGSSEAQDSNLSVYDNIVNEEQGEQNIEDREAKGTVSVAESSSSWSSCEIVPLDGSGGAASPCNVSSGQFSSFRMDSREEELRPNSPASSSAPTDAPLSTGSSEVFLPNAPQEPLGFPASHAMQCLVAGLRQQMTRQKAEYEAKINRLEQRNKVLQGEVAGLRSTLEQQRRWVSVAEIKMRNVERARADADRRNTTLQQEMEQFFETFGELNAEARKTGRIVQSF